MEEVVFESETPSTSLPSVSCNQREGFEPYKEIKEVELTSENGGGGGGGKECDDEAADDGSLLNETSDTRG